MPHWLRISLGIVCLLLGVAGLFLPFLQGVPLLLIGIALLSPYSPFIRRQEEWLLGRFPALATRKKQLHERYEAWRRKWSNRDH